MRRNRRSAPLAALAALVALPAVAGAHPLGNFSINHYTALRFGPGAVELRYIVDIAEIPTFQAMQESEMKAEADDPAALAYAKRKAEQLKDGLALVVNGRRLPLETISRTIIFPPGAGGLPTMKIGVRYRAALDAARELRVDYRDANYAERAGWKEIVAIGGEELRITDSSVPDHDQSRELSDYPTDLLLSPPQVVEAHVAVLREGVGVAAAPPAHDSPATRAAAPRGPQHASVATTAIAPGAPPHPAGPAPTSTPASAGGTTGETLTLAPNRQATPRNAFTELVATRQLGLGIILFALVVAAGFGAFHALEPGHGKTVVAAYLIGSRGTAWHALLLGLIVTVSHTAGVYLLGGVTLYAQRYVVPERLYPWIGVVSGLTIAGLGFFLFLRHYAGHHAHHGHEHHHHDGDHGHDHHDHDHGHGHHHRVPAPGEVSLKALFALGVTGGIVPCPAALVVLLSALSLGRLAFGLVLITAFSVGLAAALIVIGLLMIYARRLMARFHGDGPLITRWLPLASSAVMTALGVGIAFQALRAAGILEIHLT